MFNVVAQASTEDTRLLILVIGLVIIAVMLSGLTLWYWRYTDPKRYTPTAQAEARRVNERNPVATPKSGKSQGRPRNDRSKRTAPIDLEGSNGGRQGVAERSSLRDRNQRATSG